MVFLPGFLNPTPKPSPSCQQHVSATSPLMIFPKQLLLCHCHFTKGNFSLPHPVLALLGKRKGGGAGKVDKPWGFTSPEGSQLSGLGCLMGKESYLTRSQ